MISLWVQMVSGPIYGMVWHIEMCIRDQNAGIDTIEYVSLHKKIYNVSLIWFCFRFYQKKEACMCSCMLSYKFLFWTWDEKRTYGDIISFINFEKWIGDKLAGETIKSSPTNNFLFHIY